MKIVKFAKTGDLGNIENIRGKLLKARINTAPRGYTGATLLRMIKNGEWVYGQDNVPVADDSLWAINPSQFEHGYIAWDEGRPYKEEMASVYGPEVDKKSLPPAPEGWNEQYSMCLRCMNGADEGKEFIYKTTALGGLEAFSTVFAKLDNQLQKDPTKNIMVVSLRSTSYIHKKYGLTFKPELALAGPKWLELTKEAPVVGEIEQKADEPEPEPPRRRRRRKTAA